MCRHCARHRDMMVTDQTWNSSKGVEQRGKHKIPRVTKIPGVENATKDTPWLLRVAEVALKQRRLPSV